MKKGELLGKFIAYAANAHLGQFDKAGKPYILHVLAVLYGLKTEDEELQCIAVGHDLFEDTKTTVEDLVAIGATERVIKGILCLTKQNGESYDTYVNKVLSNTDAMLVKLSDLRHNSDITRLKGTTQKDIDRMGKYMVFYSKIKCTLADGRCVVS